MDSRNKAVVDLKLFPYLGRNIGEIWVQNDHY